MLLKVYAAVSFACADDGIGKCDRSTLSQQDLMELFIFGLAEPENCTTEGVATHPEKLHTPWQKLQDKCPSPILVFINPLKLLDISVGITCYPFPFTYIIWIIPAATYLL